MESTSSNSYVLKESDLADPNLVGLQIKTDFDVILLCREFLDHPISINIKAPWKIPTPFQLKSEDVIKSVIEPTRAKSPVKIPEEPLKQKVQELITQPVTQPKITFPRVNTILQPIPLELPEILYKPKSIETVESGLQGMGVKKSTVDPARLNPGRKTKNSNEYSRAELLAFAKERGIPLSLNKADLVSAIRNADQI